MIDYIAITKRQYVIRCITIGICMAIIAFIGNLLANDWAIALDVWLLMFASYCVWLAGYLVPPERSL